MIPVSRKNMRAFHYISSAGWYIDVVKYLKCMGIEDVKTIPDKDRYMKCHVWHYFGMTEDPVLDMAYFNEQRTITYITNDDNEITIELPATLTVSGAQLDDMMYEYDDLEESEYSKNRKRHVSVRQRKMLRWIILFDVLCLIGFGMCIPYIAMLNQLSMTQSVPTAHFVEAIIVLVLLILFAGVVQYITLREFLPYKKCPKCHSREDVYRVVGGFMPKETKKEREWLESQEGEKIWYCGDVDEGNGYRYCCEYCEEYFDKEFDLSEYIDKVALWWTKHIAKPKSCAKCHYRYTKSRGGMGCCLSSGDMDLDLNKRPDNCPLMKI